MSLHDAILLLLGMGLGLAAAVFLLGGLSMVDRIALARDLADRREERRLGREPQALADEGDADDPVDPEDVADRGQREEFVPAVLPEPPVDRLPALPGAEPVVSREEALHPLEAAGGTEVPTPAAPRAEPAELATPVPANTATPATAPRIAPAVEPAPEVVNRTVEDIFARAFLNSKVSRSTPDESN